MPERPSRTKKTKPLALKELSLRPPSSDEFERVWEEVRTGTDRSAAIVSAAYTEDVIRFAIHSRFIHLPYSELDKFRGLGGPLNGFFSVIELGHALGPYGKITRYDLQIIRRVRNCFAHAMRPITFQTPQISKEIEKLRFLTTVEGTVTIIDPQTGSESPGGKSCVAQLFRRNKDRYVETCRFISQAMIPIIDFSKRPSPPTVP